MTQSILITGCTSGIGYAAAHQLKERGYRVFATARKETDVNRLQQEGLESIQLDVTDPISIKLAVDTIIAKTGGTLDALFNNAGFLQAGAIEDLSKQLDEAQFATNVFGPMEVIRQVLPIMRKQGHGRIIQNSSILGVVTMTLCGAYNASKFALEGYSNTLRQELRGSGIYVSLINPGPIKSSLRNNAFEAYKNVLEGKQTGHFKKHYEKFRESYFKPSKQDQFLQQTPDAVVKKLIFALESSRPKAHYYVGFPAHLFAFLRRVLPDSALDWILTRMR